MALIKDKSLQNPELVIKSYLQQIAILEAEMVVVYWMDVERHKQMSFRKWSLIRNLDHWEQILQDQRNNRHIRASKTHDLNVCICSVYNCKRMMADASYPIQCDFSTYNSKQGGLFK